MPSLTTEQLKVLKNRKAAAHSAIKFFSKSVLGVQTHTGIKTVRSANNPFDGLSSAQKKAFYRNRNDNLGEMVSFKEYPYDSTYDYDNDTDMLGYIYKGRDGKGDFFDELQGGEPDSVLMKEVQYKYEDSLLGSIAQTMRTGMGNCDEKGKICYAALKCNPRLTDGHSVVSLVSSNNVVTVTKVKTKRDKSGRKITVTEEVEEEQGYDHVFVVVADVAVPDHFVRIKDLGPTTMVVDGWTQDWYFPNVGLFDAKWHGLGNTPNPRQLAVRRNVMNNPTRAYSVPADGVGAGQEVGVKRFF